MLDERGMSAFSFNKIVLFERFTANPTWYVSQKLLHIESSRHHFDYPQI